MVVEVLVNVVDVRVWILKLGPKRGNRLSLGTVTIVGLQRRRLQNYGNAPLEPELSTNKMIFRLITRIGMHGAKVSLGTPILVKKLKIILFVDISVWSSTHAIMTEQDRSDVDITEAGLDRLQLLRTRFFKSRYLTSVSSFPGPYPTFRRNGRCK